MQNKQTKLSYLPEVLGKAVSTLTEEQCKLVQGALGEQNDRQKIKTIKRILETTAQSQLKSVFSQIMDQVILHEYILGDLQSKPTVLNIFKSLDVRPRVLLSMLPHIKQFDDVKKLIQVIETLCIAGSLTPQHKGEIEQSELMRVMDGVLVEQLRQGTHSVTRNQFRTKWLDRFVEVLRCINYVVRFTVKHEEQFIEQVYSLAEKCAAEAHVLSKQVITQLYLLLVYLNRLVPEPESPLQRIHYLHASTIIKGESTLKQLLKLASELKDTEYKSQLTPILLKSFLEYFQRGARNNKSAELDEQLKQNAFDWAISLFDVGRSIYSYLEQIIEIIITKGGVWSLEGALVRKFFIAKVALGHVPTETITGMWPDCLSDCFRESGNMTLPYVTDCAEALLAKRYLQLGKDYARWMAQWIQPYKMLLLSGSRAYIRGITQFINPILLKIDSCNSLLLREISSMPQQNLSTQLGIISLIKCYKQIGKIESKHNVLLDQITKTRVQQKKNKKPKDQQPAQKPQQVPVVEYRAVFVHLDDPTFEFGPQFLLDLLLSNQPATSLQTLEFLITSRRPSLLILPEQMRIIIEFYRNCLKTSTPEYRKSYLNLTRRLLERLRKNYEKDVAPGGKKPAQHTQYFEEFINFLNELIELCFANIYPDSIFEITDPALQILQLIINLFGPRGCEIRKGTFVEPSDILLRRTTLFKIENFENLVTCLQSSYESIRSIAHEIINNFENFDEKGVAVLRQIWITSIENTNKLAIKSYEFACRMVTFISQLRHNNAPIIPELPYKYQLPELNTCAYLMQLLKARYEVFTKQFIEQTDVYYKNLIHGLLTCFSYILNVIAEKKQLTQAHIASIREFLAEFFAQMTRILNFSVEISSANISTVVLDTIATASQTDKKMTVDCRGHFLPDKKGDNSTGKTIGSYLDSTALISSMENEDEGIENTLVVSFYLLTREAGLVFQAIGGLMGNAAIAKNVPKKQLIELVNTYFYALINLKHMGSVDRIANGLSKMAKVIFDQEDVDLIKIPEQLLNKLLQLLNDGKFTNILRRSAGVPYAFTCLLKSEAIKRKVLIAQTIAALLKLSKQSAQTPIELRIHSLNILKKLFQDSDLKQDLDTYVSQAFISAIRGFTSQQWGVRNSSLMLFSVLANRTVGIKPTFNLLEFFHKCPDLLQFITEQLSLTQAPTMYPPLYPIVLLLSRLLPFDLKQKARMSIKGTTNKQIRKQELLSLRPLLERAGNNHNYMGRVMTAKAILPFMHLADIVVCCLAILSEYVKTVQLGKVDNNWWHFRLTECYQLLSSYCEIVGGRGEGAREEIYDTLMSGCKLLQWSPSSGVSPTVHQIHIRICHILFRNYFSIQYSRDQNTNKITVNTNQPEIELKTRHLITELTATTQRLFTNLRSQVGDLGHSLMYKSAVELLFTLYLNSSHYDQPDQSNYSGGKFVEYLGSVHLGKDIVDYEIYALVLEKVGDLLAATVQMNKSKHLWARIDQWLRKLDISAIHNDETIIRVLGLLSVGAESAFATPQLLQTLAQLQHKSENKHLKVAIFQYLLTLSRDPSSRPTCQPLLQSLLLSYSDPNQLQDLRECCILYLQQAHQLRPHLLLVYLRMLEDQQYEIRRRAAWQLSRLLGLRGCNEGVVAMELLWRYLGGRSYVAELKASQHQRSEGQDQGADQKQYKQQQLSQQQQLSFLTTLLTVNSDYPIRQRNHAQQRIFSYDKPNKYRTDINTLYTAALIVDAQVLVKLATVPSIVQVGWERVVQGYGESVMGRDEYGFETVMRGALVGQGIGQGQTMLAKIYERVKGK